MRFVKPLDEALLHEIFSSYKQVITVEDGCIQGGFGSAILEFMADHNYHAEVQAVGNPRPGGGTRRTNRIAPGMRV